MLDLRAPALRRLHEDWEQRRRGRHMPARGDFDPLDLKYVLGHLCLVDVEGPPLRFRYRLYGSAVAAHFGVEMTGKCVDDLRDAGHRDAANKHFSATVSERAPVVSVHELPSAIGKRNFCEVLVLPLASDGATVDQLMSALIWQRE